MKPPIITKPKVDLDAFIALSPDERAAFFLGISEEEYRIMLVTALIERRDSLSREINLIRDCVGSARELKALMIHNSKENRDFASDPRNVLYNLEAEVYMRRKALEDRVRVINAALEAIQVVCCHKWGLDGRNSHKSYYKCMICTAGCSFET